MSVRQDVEYVASASHGPPPVPRGDFRWEGLVGCVALVSSDAYPLARDHVPFARGLQVVYRQAGVAHRVYALVLDDAWPVGSLLVCAEVDGTQVDDGSPVAAVLARHDEPSLVSVTVRPSAFLDGHCLVHVVVRRVQ